MAATATLEEVEHLLEQIIPVEEPSLEQIAADILHRTRASPRHPFVSTYAQPSAPPFTIANYLLDSLSFQFSPDKAFPDQVSLKSHAALITAIELCASWGIFPVLLTCTHIFGEKQPIPPKASASSDAGIEALAHAWLDIRSPAKALKLAPSLLVQGIAAPLSPRFEGNATWRAWIRSCAKTLQAVLGARIYSTFAAEKTLALLQICYAALDEEMDEEIRERAGVKAEVCALLQAKFQHAWIARLPIFSAESAHRLERAAFARRLNSRLSAAAGRPKGLLSLLAEMVGHVPLGNTEAFAKTAAALTSGGADLEKLVAQVPGILRMTGRKETPEELSRVQQAAVVLLNRVAKVQPDLDVAAALFPVLGMELGQGDGDIQASLRYLNRVMEMVPAEQELLNALTLFVVNAFSVYAYAAQHNTRAKGEAKAVMLTWFSRRSSQEAVNFLRKLARSPHPIGSIFQADGTPTLQLVRSKTDSCGLEVVAFEPFDVVGSRSGGETESIPMRFQVEVPDVQQEMEETLNAPVRHNSRRSNVEWVCKVAEVVDVCPALIDECLRSMAARLEVKEASGQEGIAEDGLEILEVDVYILSILAHDESLQRSGEALLEALHSLLHSCLRVLGLEDGNPAQAEQKVNVVEPSINDALILQLLPILLAILASLPPSTKGTRRFLPALKNLSRMKGELSELALSLYITILDHHNPEPSKANRLFSQTQTDSDVVDPIGEKLRQICNEHLASSEPPLRAMGVDEIRDLLAPSPGLTARAVPRQQHIEEGLRLTLAMLDDSEPYVYLTAMRCSAALGKAHAEVVLEKLCMRLRQEERPGMRVRLGECLMLFMRECGEGLPQFAVRIVDTLVAECRRHGSMIEVRAGSISNLAEVCRMSPWTVIHCGADIITLLDGVLRSLTEPEMITRAAAFTLLKLVEGLSSLGNEGITRAAAQLRDINRLLSHVATHGTDPVVVGRCAAAREVVDRMMTGFLRPQGEKKLKVSLHLDAL